MGSVGPNNIEKGLVFALDGANSKSSGTRLSTDNVYDGSVDGTAWIASLTDSNFVFGDNSWSMTVWVYLPSSLALGLHQIAASANSIGASGMNWSLWEATNGATLEFRLSDGVALKIIAPTFTFDVWQCVSIGYDKDAEIMFMNLDGSYFTTSTTGFVPQAITANMAIGHELQGSHNNWEGQMMNMRFWNRALTEHETCVFHQQGRGKMYSDSSKSDLVDMMAWFPLIDDLTIDLHGDNVNVGVGTTAFTATTNNDYNTQKELIGKRDFLIPNAPSGDNPQALLVDRSYDFDGVDDYIDLGDVHDLEWDTPFTLEAWVNTTTDVGTQYIASKFQSIQPYRGWGMFLTNRLNLVIASDESNWPNSGYQLRTAIGTTPLNEWAHCVITWDGSGSNAGATAYINGVSTTLSVASGTAIATGSTSSNTPMFIGAVADTGTVETPDNFFDGQISNVKIYKKELTPAEVKNNYDELKYRFI